MFRLHHALFNIAAALCLWNLPAPCVAGEQDQDQSGPAFKTSREVAARVRREYCSERPFYAVKVRRNAAGEIGGYVLQPAIRDAPIPFLDSEGSMLTSFHIFGSDAEKRDAMAIVAPLTRQFPLEEALDCATGAAGR